MGSQAPIYRVCMRNSRLVVIPLTDATYNLASPGFPPNRKQIVFYRVQIVFYKDRITRRYYREAYRLIVSWALHPIQASTLKQTCNIRFIQAGLTCLGYRAIVLFSYHRSYGCLGKQPRGCLSFQIHVNVSVSAGPCFI